MSLNLRHVLGPLAGLSVIVASLHCGDDGATNAASSDDAGGSSTIDSGNNGAVPTECASETAGVSQAVCAANAFLETLSAAQRSTANPAYTDNSARTKWSNLPGQARPGVKMGDLTAEQQAAALAMMNTVLTSEGQTDLAGIRAADDYLGAQGGGGGPGGGQYAASNYYVAVIGAPSATDNWEVMFGGHHMAFNVNFVGGVGYPVPNHLGVEPKGEFTQGGATYAPLDPEGAAMLAIFTALDTETLAQAKLSGTFSDVLVGPAEYGSGSYAAAKAKFPTGSSRGSVAASTLPQATQDLVTAAIKQWVEDYSPSFASALVTEYTSATAYADTFVAWAGSASTVDVDSNGTYMRIDGPRVWIELSCQSGVVIQGKTHFHTIYRDKQFDYGNTLQ